MRVLVDTNILLRSAQPNHPPVQGVKVYDARLVAVMTVYAVESILSFNSVDFKRYDFVTALHPASLLA